MYRPVINNKLVDSSPQKRDIKINFGKVYIFLLVFSFALIYFYSVMQDNYLSIMIPYRIIWPISIIFIGISIFRVKNSAAFSVGFFITTLSVGITITSTFVYSSNITYNNETTLVRVSDANSIATDINFTATRSNIRSERENIFRSDFISNYDKVISNSYRDENQVENIKLEYNLLPPGIGAYNKNSEILFPNNIPISFKINSNLSLIEANISNLKLESGHISSNNSIFDIVIKDIDLEKNALLDISSNLSRLNIIISKDVPIIVTNSSRLSQIEFIGISKSTNSSNVYQTITQANAIDNQGEAGEVPEENKKLIINLNSTLSQIKITQR